jgi:hypothetical protein
LIRVDTKVQYFKHCKCNLKKKNCSDGILKFLTLSYSSEGCLICIQASLSLDCIKLNIPGFPHNCIPVSCGDSGFKKILSLVLARKSGLKVPFLPVGTPGLALQTILLSNLVGFDSPSADSNGLLAQRVVTPNPESSISNIKGAKLPLISAEGCHIRRMGNIAL